MPADDLNTERRKHNTCLGSTYPFLKALCDESSFTDSFLRPEFTSVEDWKAVTRRRLWERIPEKPEPCDFRAQVVERVDKGDYTRELVYFNTSPNTRVPAFVLIPKGAKRPLPGLVCFHDHGGMYYWGKEKIVEVEDEHPVLTDFKRACYEGRSYASDFCRAGYAVIVTDAFYWGERRLVSDGDVDKGINHRQGHESAEVIRHVNGQSAATEDSVARAIYQTGHTWQGIWLRDEIRSLDYLLTRPEVDPKRVGCVGLSIGGFRSAQFAGLDPRIRCAVVAGWMTTYAEMFASRPYNTHYLQYITGAYSLVDLPDMVSMCCPNGLMVTHGRRDVLFTPKGVADAYAKIQAIYDKAGASANCNLRYYDTPHEFNREMQADALAWLKKWLM